VALSLYLALKEEAPDDGAIALGLARCLLCIGKGDEARPILESLLARDPRHAEARLLRSSLLS
jgi:thioredoxin-like negative regulator of GroEL